jgi:hypothetical protein
MTAYQHNRCAVCHETFTETPRIDHDHTTRNVRGLLCNRCNLGLGYFRDNVTILSNAIEYLEKGPQKYAVSYKQSLPVITPVKPYR